MPAYASAGVHPEQREHLAGLIVIQLTRVFAILSGGSVLQGRAGPAGRGPLLVPRCRAAGRLDDPLRRVPRPVLRADERHHARGGTPRLVWVVSVLGAASNVALLLIFVPSDGIMAAAIASAAAYLVLSICILVCPAPRESVALPVAAAARHGRADRCGLRRGDRHDALARRRRDRAAADLDRRVPRCVFGTYRLRRRSARARCLTRLAGPCGDEARQRHRRPHRVTGLRRLPATRARRATRAVYADSRATK